MAAFLPPAGPGRVLITSQNPDWPGQAMDVPVLDPDVAAGFLISRTGDPDRQAARDLADELGGLPLALEQAAAYIAGHRDDPGRVPVAVPAAAGGPAGPRRAHRAPGDGGDHLGAGLRPGWGTKRRRRSGLLQLLACCAPEPMPLRLLLHSDAQARRGARPGRRGHVLGRCWVIRSLPGMRSPRCAATRWSPRPGTAWCWCTAWSRPSPSTRCPRTWPASGSRPPRP